MGTGGDITLNARSDVNTRKTTSTNDRGSGNINLTSQERNIRTGTIHTDTGSIQINSPFINAAKISISIAFTDADKTIASLEERQAYSTLYNEP